MISTATKVHSRIIEGIPPGLEFVKRGEQLMRLQGRVLANIPEEIEADKEISLRLIKEFGDSSSVDCIDEFKAEFLSHLTISHHRMLDIQTMLQLFLCRHVDDFQTFLEHILRDIAQFEPSILDNIKIRKSAKHLSKEERRALQLRKLSYLSIREIREAIDPHFELFPNSSVRKEVERIFEIRNLYVHNYGIADRHFLSRHQDPRFIEGKLIDLDPIYLQMLVRVLLSSCTDIQSRTHFNFGILWTGA
jgi:hypothetical protein